MARTSKKSTTATREPASEPSAPSAPSATSAARAATVTRPAWASVHTPGTGTGPAVGARSGGLGIGSPIYEELVAELGDPAA